MITNRLVVLAPLAAVLHAMLLADLSPAAAPPPAVARATLANGLQVVAVRDPLAPVAATVMSYRVGSVECAPGFPGTAHALEHMMFRGSPGLTAEQLANITAALGGEFNADTQQTATRYYFTVPAEDLEVALRIEAVRMAGIAATPELWEKERGAIEQEVAGDLSNPLYLFSSRLLAALFPGTPYEHDALGTRESFGKTTAETLAAFHRDWYSPENAVLVVAGDLEPGTVLDLARRVFEPIPRRPRPARPEVKVPPARASRIDIDTDLPYGLVAVAYRMPGYDSPLWAAGQVLADALDSRRAALYTLVTEGKALFTEFGAEALPRAGFGYALAGFPAGGDPAALIAALKKVIAGYAKDGVPAALVEAAVRKEVAAGEYRLNSVSGCAMAWADALVVEGRTSPDDDIEAIRRVTADDVNRAAREFLVTETAITAVLTPKPSGAPVTSKKFGGGESFAPRDARPVELPAWAAKAAALPSAPSSGLHPVDATLPNGLRLIVQTEDVSPTVILRGSVRTRPELQEPPGKEGVSAVLDGLFSYGTQSLDRLAYQEALDAIAADVEAGTSFSLRVLADRFERGLELLADDLLRPALPQDAFVVVQDETADAVAGQLKTPAYLAGRAIKGGLYPADDPTLRQATPATVRSLSLDDVRAYHRQVFRPDLSTIVIVGKVSPEAARAAVEKAFGRWTASGPKPPTDLPPVPANKPSSTAVPDASRVQDDVTLAVTLPITRTHPDYYALELGDHVLSGAFYATRLESDLRQKAGLVYSVDSSLEAGRTRAAFTVTYACDPPNVSRARAIVEKDLREMATGLATADELRQAKTLLVRGVPLSEESVERIAAGLLARSLADLPLDEPTLAARRYLDLTGEAVRDAFRRCLRPEDLVQVTLGPPPL